MACYGNRFIFVYVEDAHTSQKTYTSTASYGDSLTFYDFLGVISLFVVTAFKVSFASRILTSHQRPGACHLEKSATDFYMSHPHKLQQA
jgi:hypothetical protein